MVVVVTITQADSQTAERKKRERRRKKRKRKQKQKRAHAHWLCQLPFFRESLKSLFTKGRKGKAKAKPQIEPHRAIDRQLVKKW